MAKGKSTWKYNKLLTAKRNYYSLGSFLNNIAGNPENGKLTTGAFKGMPTEISGALQGVGSAVGQLGGGLLSGGMTSGAGNVLSGLSSIASAIPGPWGAVASAGLGLMSGLTNRTFGSKMNTENIAKVEANIRNLSNFQSNASDFDTLSQNWADAEVGMTFDDSFIGKDGWFSSKAKDKAANLRKQVEAGNAWVQNTLVNNAENISTAQAQNLLGNYAAFGGPMDFGGGAIGYDFMNKYLGIKELAALGQDATLSSLPNSFAEGGGIHIKEANKGKFTKYCGGNVTAECIARGKRSSSPAVRKRATFAANARKWKHAFGGDLLTHGANFDTGVTLIGNGGTHEENPNEGVPIGMDTEGIPNLVEEGEVIFNDYVFSNRLKIPKEVRKKYKLRGTKSITFAEAATQMSKESEERPNDPISKAGLEDSMMKLMIAQEQVRSKNEKNRFAKGGKMARKYVNGSQLLFDRPVDMDDMSWMDELSAPKDDTSTDTFETNLAPTWMRYVPAFASGIMSITDATGLTNKPDYSEADMVLDAARGAGTYSPVGFSPIGNYLGYTPFDREFYINQMNAQAGATRRNLLNTSGGNRATAMAGLLAADNNYLNQLGMLARQAEEYNLAQRQKVEEFNRATNMFNTEGALKADMANQEAMLKVKDAYLKGTLSAAELKQRERQQSAAARSANLSNFINSLGDIGRENFARNMIVSDPSKYYTIDEKGRVTYKNGFDNLSDAEKRQVRGHAAEHGGTSFARGGLLTRRKRRK